MGPRPTEPPPPMGGARRPTHARRQSTLDDDVGARVQAGRAAFAAIRTLRIIRGYFVGYAVICGLVLAAMVLRDASPVGLGVALALTVVSVAGALLVIQQPLLWTTVNAVLITPVVAFAVFGLLRSAGSLTDLLVAFTGLGFWAAVPVAARLQRLMREYPDLWAFRTTQGEMVGRHLAKWRVEAARARRRVLIGLGVSLLAVVGLVAWAMNRTPSAPEERPLPVPTRPFDQAEMAWRSAWNGSRVDEVKGFLAANERAQHEPFFDRQRKKRAWDKLPNLQAPTLTDHGGNRRSAEYALDERNVPLKVFWEWEPERWVVVNWSFPNR